MAGRPRKYEDGTTSKCISVPVECKEIWDKARELSSREGSSVSEIVNKALAQYIGEHYPGNPQVPLEVAKSVSLMQEYITIKAIGRLRGIASIKWESDHAKNKATEKALALAMKVRNPSQELLDLMEKAVKGIV